MQPSASPCSQWRQDRRGRADPLFGRGGGHDQTEEDQGARLPVALLRNATLLAGFGSMYFAVTAVSDTEHRKQFFARIIDEIERTHAVHADK